MVSIRIENQPLTRTMQFLNYLSLELSWQNFNCFLEDSASILVQGKLLNLNDDNLRQLFNLLLASRLKHLLYHIVPKNISHQ